MINFRRIVFIKNAFQIRRMTKGGIQGQGHGRRDRGLTPNTGLGKTLFTHTVCVCKRGAA